MATNRNGGEQPGDPARQAERRARHGARPAPRRRPRTGRAASAPSGGQARRAARAPAPSADDQIADDGADPRHQRLAARAGLALPEVGEARAGPAARAQPGERGAATTISAAADGARRSPARPGTAIPRLSASRLIRPPRSAASPAARSAIRSSGSSRPIWSRTSGPSQSGAGRGARPDRRAGRGSRSRPSYSRCRTARARRSAASRAASSPPSRTKEKRPVAPLKSRAQYSWPGQSGQRRDGARARPAAAPRASARP